MIYRTNRVSPHRPACAGFTLVEAMVALLVLSVGVIGVAVLHGQSLAASRAAIFRSQAINLASDLADRIRANRGAQSAYEAAEFDHGCGKPTAHGGVDCTPTQLAAHDLYTWNAEVTATLPGGRGSVMVDLSTSPATYTVTVSWDETNESGRASLPLTFRLPVF